MMREEKHKHFLFFLKKKKEKEETDFASREKEKEETDFNLTFFYLFWLACDHGT